MNKKIFLLAFIIIEMLVMPNNYGQKQSGTVRNSYVVPTYECAGLYWKVKEEDPCKIKYREQSGKVWKEGLPLVYDNRDGEYRGSMVDLSPNADYVIIRGAEIRNAALHGILIRKNRHDIVIEQCHITFWGRIGGPKTYGNLEGGSDSGIYAETGTENLTIQRNLIEDPRGASNDWETGHPDGPQGISIIQSGGGNVIRYNDIVSSEDHGFNDGIGGGSNFSFTGNMNRDSDIYGNIIRNAWDDAIESEGGNMNVRLQ